MKTLIIQKSRSIEKYRKVQKGIKSIKSTKHIYRWCGKRKIITQRIQVGVGGEEEEQWRLWPRPRRLFSPILVKILPQVVNNFTTTTTTVIYNISSSSLILILMLILMCCNILIIITRTKRLIFLFFLFLLSPKIVQFVEIKKKTERKKNC